MILAGDIGGTHARLAFFNHAQGRLTMVSEATFPSRQYPGLEHIVSAFVEQKPERVEAACFGIAGPIRNGRSQVSNLPWIVDSGELARTLNLRSAYLINDLEANAWGVGALAETDLVTLHPGSPSQGNQAVIAAGTGLGEAGLFWDGRQQQAFACEGGHADFGPRNELEIELLAYLMGSFGRVSYERVLSGPGLVNLYHFLRNTGRGQEPKWLAEQMAADDKALVISRAAMDGSSSLCEQALELFISIYGAEAGNLALKIFSIGGIFLSGGIAPKILTKLKGKTFLEAFVDKGRMQPLLEAMPVHVVINESTGLWGAARCAMVRMSWLI